MPAHWRARMPKREWRDWDYPNRRLAAFCKQAGIPVLDLGGPLRHYVDETGIPLHGFKESEPPIGHWNDAGHRQAGLRLVEWVAQQYRPHQKASASHHRGSRYHRIPSSSRSTR